ncbi:peptidoglycan DD-metalloendopeptidase family protein [Roseovarius sp.]|uniref:peptidoglycan DD-metalloendopeptidase family protein n=1 Tax=Roseovarius sp. TaxID=1486281 RepID=UPI00261380DE|nr:peptidoglycan DD-metalloendopeptidase family protein [Roseovarius sp.]
MSGPLRPVSRRPVALRTAAAVSLFAVLAACEAPLDYDLRGQIGAFNTTEAAQTAVSRRPKPDERGLITYPNYQVAVARRGDTVASVSERIGLPTGEVARFNGVQPDDKLRAGEVLALPRRAPNSPTAVEGPDAGVDIEKLAGDAIASAPDTTPVATKPLPPAPVQKPVVQGGPEPVRHKVERGETAYTISRLYQVPVKSLAEWNGLGSDFSVREGQYLLIPLKNQPAPKVAPAATTQPGEGSATPTPPSSTKALPKEKTTPAAEVTPPKPAVKVPAPTRTSSSEMDFPVTGKIIRTYSKGKNDGIDISAAAGSPVRAAAAGTVAAITADADQVPIIVVRHDAKLLTVYANVDKITIKKGDKVKRGQQIAALRGGDKAYLHFEVRNGFDSVDPMPYLK